MGRTVADLSLLLSVMSGHDPRAPLSSPEPPLPAALLDGDVAGQRVGWLADYAEALADRRRDPCREPARRSTAFTSAGCLVEDAPLAFDRERIWTCWLGWRHTLMAGRFGAMYADPATRALMKPELVWEVEGGLRLQATDFYAASVTRTALRARLGNS